MDDLPQIYHLPLIGLNDFPAFVEIIVQDDAFPATFDAWEIHLNAREEEILGAGHLPVFLERDSDRLSAVRGQLDRQRHPRDAGCLCGFVGL